MILSRQRSVRVARRPLEQFLQRMVNELGLSSADVTICLVSEAEIGRMNETFRKKAGPTDVLSFPAAGRGKYTLLPRTRIAGRRKQRDRRASRFLGDIAISPAVAKRNARTYRRSLTDELRVLMLHGVLHLMGYDHETDSGEMDRVERRLRRRLGLT